MSKKYNTIFLLNIFAISLLGSMVSITEEVTPPALQAGDMSIMAQVTATNITLYMASSNSLLNVTSKITNFQQVNIISGTDTNILYQTFITNLYSQYLKSLQMTPSGDIVPAVSQLITSLNLPITLYSLSAAGFKHLGLLPTLQTFLPKLKGFHPTYIPTQPGVLQDFSSPKYIADINAFASTLGVNQSDFNAIGKEASDQEQFKTADVLSAGTRSYTQLNMVNTDTPLDPSYEQYGLDSGILDTAGATTNASLST